MPDVVLSVFPHERWRQETQELEFKSSLRYMRPCRGDKVKLEKKGRDEEDWETRRASPHEIMPGLQQTEQAQTSALSRGYTPPP